MTGELNIQMKVILFLPLFIIGQDQKVWESKHHPVAHTHGNGVHNCRSYAVTSTFNNRDKIVCDPTTAILEEDSVPTSIEENSNQYFEFIPIIYQDDGKVSDDEVSKLLEKAEWGDIILWGSSEGSGHAAVIMEVFKIPTLNLWYRIRVNQMPNEGGEVEEDVPLFYTKGKPYGDIVGLARKRKLWKLKVKNNFEGGNVGVDGIELYGSSEIIQSGETIGPFHWGSQFTLSAIEHERTHNGDTQYFQHWQKTHPILISEKYDVYSIDIALTDHDYAIPATFKATYFAMNNVKIKNDFSSIGNYGYLFVDDFAWIQVVSATVYDSPKNT